ncbi:hypothetical protein PybrP1_000854 [[Pythium] brassicae (nom. inval.)]|nr:hypothetical protein PybrP1_000854 [[Pythium] brassicae (nom. inval.)]
MKSPKRSGLAFLAEYQFGDDNVLIATFHEQQRLRNEDRVRNAQSTIRPRDISASDDDIAINNAKRLQQEQDRRDAIERHNMLLLSRLEKIHQCHVPKQFDVSHLPEEVLNAPRHSNAALRRREQLRIGEENAKMSQRLQLAKGAACSNKQLARDADRNRYLTEQISKVTRRRKVREICQSLSEQHQYQHQHQSASRLEQVFERFDHEAELEHGLEHPVARRVPERASRRGIPDAQRMSGCKSLSRLDQHNASGFAHAGRDSVDKLPPLHQSRYPLAKQQPHATLANTTKVISALDLRLSTGRSR